ALSKNDRPSEQRFFTVWLALLVVGCALVILVVAFASDWIVSILLGPQFRTAAGLLPWLSLGSMLWVLGLTYQRRLYGTKQTKALLCLRSVTTPIILGIIATLTYFDGLRGAAIATVVCNGLELLIFILHAHGPWRYEKPAVVS